MICINSAKHTKLSQTAIFGLTAGAYMFLAFLWTSLFIYQAGKHFKSINPHARILPKWLYAPLTLKRSPSHNYDQWSTYSTKEALAITWMASMSRKYRLQVQSRQPFCPFLITSKFLDPARLLSHPRPSVPTWCFIFHRYRTKTVGLEKRQLHLTGNPRANGIQQ